jgi:hypothetical protein
MKHLLPLATLLVVFGCAKEKTAEAPPPATAETTTTAAATQPLAAAAPPQATMTLAADAPIPGTGVLLWVRADDAVAKDGKLQSWPNVKPAHDDQLPAVVPNALNGHSVVRFDGTDQMLMSNVDIGPKRMPEGTVISVFRSATADASPLRKLYGDDNGSYDRAAGLDDRAAGKNYTLFTGIGVEGYLQLTANTTYIAVDEYSPKEFNGWINGAATLAKTPADWGEDALPDLYIGGTGTVYQEFWNGDLAEMIVYARKLSDAERTKVEDYLAQKYGVTLTRR